MSDTTQARPLGLFGPAAELGIARGVAQAGLAAATILIARDLGVDGLGRYAFFTASGSVVVSSVWTGVAVFASRQVARTGGWSLGLATRLLPIVVVGGLFVIAGGVVADGASGAVPGAVGAVSYLCSGVLALGSGILCGAGRFRRAAAGEVVAGLALPLLTALAVTAGMGLVGALGAIGAASSIGVAFMVSGLPTPASPAPSWSSLWPFALIGLASAGYARLDAVAIRAAATEDVLGIYSAAYRLLGPLLIIASAFGSVFFSRLSAGDLSADRSTLRRGTALLGALLVPVAAVEWALAPWLIRTLYGAAFEPAVAPARILLVSAVALAVYWPRAHVLNAGGRERLWAACLAGAALVDAVAAGVAVRFGGASGAAWAWLGTECLLAGLLVKVVRPS